jgi:hypothetical protein
MLSGLKVEVNPNLVKLEVSNLDGVTLEFLTELGRFIPNLKSLKILKSVGEEVVEHIWAVFKELTELENRNGRGVVQ